MEETREGPSRKRKKGYSRLKAFVYDAPFDTVTLLNRLIYGFRVEGEENLPQKGPYITWYTEPGLMGLISAMYVSTKTLHQQMDLAPGKARVLAFFQEELFRVPYIQKATAGSLVTRGLTPHSAPHLAKGMMDGYRMLLDKGVVLENPQGDATWDGRPVAFGRIMVWLALRTAAPISPALVTIGAYEIWPRWQRLPSLKGRMKLVIDKPFTLTDVPLDHVTDEDMVRGQARVREYFERIHYGPGGLSGWIGPVLRDGVEVTEPVQLRPPSKPLADVPPSKVRFNKRGVTQLLWQCPVCRTNDALVHRQPPFRRETVVCRACGTLWDFQRRSGHDFRMKVLEGPPDVIGLDMALSTWYEHMNRNFSPKPIQVADVSLLPGEEVYLEAPDVLLSPHRPNPLFSGWTSREPPKRQAGQLEVAGWDAVGKGRLLVTSHRALWQGEMGELDFMWSEVTAVSQYLTNVLALHYGSAKYRFNLVNELVLKWLHHMGELAKKAGTPQGRTVNVTHH